MSKPEFLSFSSSELMPQAEMLEIKTSKSELNIGIPREIFRQEKRVGLTPDSVQLLVNNGHKVLIEKGAGDGANYSDKDYEEAGGEICYSKEKVFQSDIILKIEPPSLEEIGMMKHRQTLISALQLRTQTKEYFEKLMEKKITALSFENIADESGIIPVVRSMSEIAGSTSVLVAAECLSNANDGKGYMLGGVSGIPPTDVVIIGAGTVGVYAAKTALGLGATVKVFDKSVTKLRRLQGIINMPIYTCVIQPKILEKALMRCDVAIGAIRSDSGRTPTVVTEDMVSKMKAGSVIIDISIDQGGCFETSELCDLDNPTIRKYDVIHYCVPNIASRVSRTASFSLSNILAPLLLSIGDSGGIEEILKQNSGVNRGLYICKGILVSKAIGDWFDLPFAEDSRLLY